MRPAEAQIFMERADAQDGSGCEALNPGDPPRRPTSVALQLAVALAIAAALAAVAGLGHTAIATGTLQPVSGRQVPIASAMNVVTINGVTMESRDRHARAINREFVGSSDKRALFEEVTNGDRIQMPAVAASQAPCDRDGYMPSEMERAWLFHSLEWTASEDILCKQLEGDGDQMLAAIAGEEEPSARVFSTMCLSSKKPQLLEPLAGILRSPLATCPSSEAWDAHLFDVDFLLLADKDSAGLTAGARRLFFDAGGSNFIDALRWFTAAYAARGIVFDQVFVWEIVPRGTEAYWNLVPPEVRAEWEPRVTFYDGVGVTADPADEANNVVERIKKECRPEDFCSWKLDIDCPSVELPLVEQLLASPEAQQRLDELFFEHHVHGIMQRYGWGEGVNGTVADSYNMFSMLRSQGVRAHSWV